MSFCPRIASPLMLCIRLGLFSIALLASSGLSCATKVSDLKGEDLLQVNLDSNARTYVPGFDIKFYVEITNKSGGTIDLEDLSVELQVHSEPGKVALREDWTYRWKETMHLPADKKLTLPIVRGRGLGGVELPLELLAEGTYGIVAVINGAYSSPPYTLKVLRPDLGNRPPPR